jgi:hypothetical protein
MLQSIERNRMKRKQHHFICMLSSDSSISPLVTCQRQYQQESSIDGMCMTSLDIYFQA